MNFSRLAGVAACAAVSFGVATVAVAGEKPTDARIDRGRYLTALRVDLQNPGAEGLLFIELWSENPDLAAGTLKDLTMNRTYPLRPLGDVVNIVQAGGIFEYARKNDLMATTEA